MSENKEHDRKHRKLDHLIDLAGDGSGVAGGEFVICWFYLIISNIHLQFYLEDDEGIDWNVARSLYSIADIQSCIDKNLYELEVDAAYGLDYCNWMIDCGGEKISIVSSSSMVQNIHPLPFDETVFSNADVLTFLSLKFGPGLGDL
ncbi:unnamed protein product [Rhizophagus irregularis]|uniref:Uncharacterized protein n=1 Tax=Rhizophagus irregularis TaxID=588596 RepID=A0A915ZVD4_9GLOM|nr:unnamed protein product [Rhizophagus irregularis]CAB5389702.1 unnamed protein product [Rhizophagus irregularis]